MADALRQMLGLFLPLGGTAAWGGTNFALDSGGASIDRAANAIQYPWADAITHCGFRYGLRTGTPVQHKIGLQGVDGSGNPDGTYKGGGSPASGTFTPPADTTWNGVWQWIALANSYTPATPGEDLAIVIEPVGTPDGSNNSSFTYILTGTGQAGRIGHPYGLTQSNAGVWTHVAGSPFFGVKSATRMFSHGGAASAFYTTTMGTNGHRQALRFKLASGWGSTFKVIGVRWLITTPIPGQTYKLGLWEGTTEHQVVTRDSDFTQVATATSWAFFETYFDDAPVTLNYGTAYYIGMERVASACGINGLSLSNAAELASFPGGAEMYYSTFDGSSWTDSQVMRPAIDLILDGITVPVASTNPVGFPKIIQGIGTY